MARISKKEKYITESYNKILEGNKELSIALKIESLTADAYGKSRLLYSIIMTNLNNAYSIWNSVSEDDDPTNFMVEFVNYIMNAEGHKKYISNIIDNV